MMSSVLERLCYITFICWLSLFLNSPVANCKNRCLFLTRYSQHRWRKRNPKGIAETRCVGHKNALKMCSLQNYWGFHKSSKLKPISSKIKDQNQQVLYGMWRGGNSVVPLLRRCSTLENRRLLTLGQYYYNCNWKRQENWVVER